MCVLTKGHLFYIKTGSEIEREFCVDTGSFFEITAGSEIDREFCVDTGSFFFFI